MIADVITPNETRESVEARKSNAVQLIIGYCNASLLDNGHFNSDDKVETSVFIDHSVLIRELDNFPYLSVTLFFQVIDDFIKILDEKGWAVTKSQEDDNGFFLHLMEK